jgi:hypothetical protein
MFFFRSLKSSAAFDRVAPGRSISTPPGAAPLFRRGSYWFSGIHRSRVVMQQQIESSRLSAVRTRRPPLVARGTPQSSRRTPCHDDGLDHHNSLWAWGDRTARVPVWPPASVRGAVRLPGGPPVWPPASTLGRRSLTTTAHWGVHGIIHLLLQVF